MKTVTADFVEAQKSPDAKSVRVIEFKRRYWDPATRAYVWENSWTELDVDYISTLSPVTWQLDTEILNEFKVSNVTLVLDNRFGYFNPSNPAGFFSQDSGSPVFGYEPYWTKFRVKSGFTLADNTDELVTIFTGVLSGDPLYDSDNKTVQFTIQGLESTLLNATAEDMATHITQENLGTGNGATTEFTTAQPGVGGVTLVSVAGISQVEGDDFSVSQINDATLGAKITFTNAPNNGEVVRATYFYWPQGLQFHEIVEELLDSAGVAEADQDIQPVVFGGSVLNSQEYTSQADWLTGTLENLEATSLSGSLLTDFNASGFRTAQTWSTSTSGWTGSGFTSDGTYIRAGTSAARIYRDSTATQGTWEFVYRDTATGSPNKTHITKFVFICTSVDAGSVGQFTGYALKLITNNSGGSPNEIRLHRKDSLTGGDGTDLGSYNIADSTAEHTIRITRLSDGHIDVYYDGTLAISADDATISSSSYFAIINTIASSAASGIETRAIVTPPTTTVCRWTSPVIDGSAAPTAWDTISKSFIEDGETITIETATSTDGISFDSYVAISGGDLPQSALKRYFKIRFYFTQENTTLDTDPQFNSIALRWINSSSVVTLPAFTGLSVYEAIQKVGEFTNYEFGYGPDEVFFFRPKTPGSVQMDLTQSDYISKISGFNLGYAKVYGAVRATYGEITREIVDTSDFPESPTARLGKRRFEISPDSNIQIPPTADIATGVAAQLFSYFSRPKKRFKLSTKLIQQLDISDVVTVTLVNNTPSKLWWLGDNDVNLGDLDVFLWGEQNQLAYSMDVKVIGARYDTEQRTCEFDMEEVL